MAIMVLYRCPLRPPGTGQNEDRVQGFFDRHTFPEASGLGVEISNSSAIGRPLTGPSLETICCAGKLQRCHYLFVPYREDMCEGKICVGRGVQVLARMAAGKEAKGRKPAFSFMRALQWVCVGVGPGEQQEENSEKSVLETIIEPWESLQFL